MRTVIFFTLVFHYFVSTVREASSTSENNVNTNIGSDNTQGWHIHVTMHVYSGRPDPTWRIPDNHEAYKAILSNMGTFPTLSFPSKLGYKGFSLVHVPPGANVVTGSHYNQTLTSHPDWEMFVLQTSQGIGDGLRQHAKQSILQPLSKRMRRSIYDSLSYPSYYDSGLDLGSLLGRTTVDPIDSLTDNDMYKLAKMWGMDKRFKNITVTEKPPGPTRFEPEKWNKHLVKEHNNCYNYANDRMTDTFAQPGRGGDCNATIYMTHGYDFEKLAKCDGLVVVSAPDKASLPAHTWNLVALVFWPPNAGDNTFDYHWYRLDGDGYWSHKPGKTEAVNVDQSDNRILDPRKADRGPYTQFIAFLQTRQDKIRVI